MIKAYVTKAYQYKTTRIAVLQMGDQFKIMKKCINYIKGRNVESWKILGGASTFNNLDECMVKFSSLVNGDRKSRGKEPLNFIVE